MTNLLKDLARVLGDHLTKFANTPDDILPQRAVTPADFVRYMTPDSSVAVSVGYRDSDQTLEIVYRSSNAVWHYREVPFDVFEEMMDGRSVGNYISRVIKPNFKKATQVKG